MAGWGQRFLISQLFSFFSLKIHCFTIPVKRRSLLSPLKSTHTQNIIMLYGISLKFIASSEFERLTTETKENDRLGKHNCRKILKRFSVAFPLFCWIINFLFWFIIVLHSLTYLVSNLLHEYLQLPYVCLVCINRC